jgi:hypothetical protein
VLWYLIVAFSDRQFFYLALLLGFFVGYAASYGAKRGGPQVAAIAAVIAVLAVVLSYYYIDRHAFLDQFGDVNRDAAADLAPLLPGLGFLWDVVKAGLDEEPIRYLFWLLAGGAAGWVGLTGRGAQR